MSDEQPDSGTAAVLLFALLAVLAGAGAIALAVSLAFDVLG